MIQLLLPKLFPFATSPPNFWAVLQREVIFVTSWLLPLTREQFRNKFSPYRKEFASKGAN